VSVAEHPQTSHQGEFLAFILPLSAGIFRKTPSPSPFGQRNEPHPHQCQIATKCGNEFVAICRLLPARICRHLLPSPECFSRGQALLLVKTRFLRPRSGRSLDAECLRNRLAYWPWPCPVRDRVQAETSPQPRFDRVRNQSVTVFSPRPQPRPQSARVRELSVSVSSPHPRRVHPVSV